MPYGFVQSPIISSLVLSISPLGRVLRALPRTVTVGVYLDDISISSDDRATLAVAYAEIVDHVEPSGFLLNGDKAVPPSEAIQLFNCEMRQGFSAVRESRRDEFYAVPRTEWSEVGFKKYCASVERGNA